MCERASGNSPNVNGGLLCERERSEKERNAVVGSFARACKRKKMRKLRGSTEKHREGEAQREEHEKEELEKEGASEEREKEEREREAKNN